ncbi:MAG: hypothetical protein J0L73_13585 [Verrucomicrobia bacterium]|nr:hypothetical protein [Verrucomicrobiota bacterium]
MSQDKTLPTAGPKAGFRYSRRWNDPDGRAGPLRHLDEGGTLAIAEVDLNAPTHWNSLGDFKAQIQSHRPPALKEP